MALARLLSLSLVPAEGFKIYPVEIDFDELSTGTPQEIADGETT